MAKYIVADSDGNNVFGWDDDGNKISDAPTFESREAAEAALAAAEIGIDGVGPMHIQEVEEKRDYELERILYGDYIPGEDDEEEEKDFSGLLDEFIDNSNMRLEGERGVESLEKICEALGYRETGFRWGSPLESFLADNPGCIEAMLDWIREWGERTPEWREGIESQLPEEDEERDEEADE